MTAAPATARAMPRACRRAGRSPRKTPERPHANTGESETRTAEAATLVRRSDVIHDAKWSARATPAMAAMRLEERSRRAHSRRPDEAASAGASIPVANVSRQAAMAKGGAAVRRISGAAQDIATTATAITSSGSVRSRMAPIYLSPMRSRLLVALLLGCLTAPLAAQTESNLYLPIDSWTTPYVEHLIRAGVLQGLDPLTRPLKRSDVARAVARVDTTDLAESVKSSLRLMAWELEERPDTIRWKLEANVAAQGASDPSRWTVRPERENSGLFWLGGLTGSFEFPHVGMVTNPFFDTRLLRDTQFTGYKQRFIAGTNAEAYVIGSWKYLEVFFGIEPRNWGPPEVEGLLLSPSPYPYDHLMVRLGPRRFRLELIATQLDNLPMTRNGLPGKRYLSLHRLIVTPSDRLSLSLSEGALTADTGGPSRSVEPWYLNLANLWLLSEINSSGPIKDFLVLDVSWLAGRSLRLAGQLFANDIRVDKGTPDNPEKPEELGYTLSLTGPALHRLASWSVFYTRVDNNVYQTQKGSQFQYSLRGVGLGRDHIDYDQVTARAGAAVAPRALVGGEITYIRQGQGDFRQPFPPLQLLADSLRFLTGTVERTLRLAAQANWTPTPGINLSADIGRHFIWNANHVKGQRGDRWVWRIRAEIRRRTTGAIRWKD
jgi:hypothetical protein